MVDELAELRVALHGRFTLEREIGRGGMATVWRARDLKNQRDVALKVLRSDVASTLAVERFRREIAIAGRLTHPNIVPLFDSGKAGRFLYYIMPYVPGESLRQRLKRDRQLPLGEALGFAREVADALDYAHRHGIVHRDIKPENILLEEGHAVVTDFGVARAIAAAATRESLTEMGLVIGTLHYVSPEQAAGERHIDGRADMYALGCVLYEMITGVPPFDGDTAESVLRQHIVAEPRPLCDFRKEIPDCVEGAVRKALAKAPSDRWGSGTELMAALTGETPVPRTSLGRRWRRAAIAIAIAVVGAAAAVRLFWSAAPSSLAVLYFENVTNDSDQAYLAEGLTEEIITRLGDVRRLAVKSRTAVERFRGKPIGDPATLGRVLGVDHLVNGTVRREQRGLRVTVELVQAQSGVRIWGAEFEPPDSGLQEVEGEIASAVAAAIAGRLNAAERASLRQPARRDAEAYDQYLRGNHYLAQRTARAVARAIAEYDGALRRDPGFVEALARQAYAYALFLYYGWTYPGLPAESLLARGEATANTAVRADSTLAEGWLARGRMLEMVHPRTYEGAIASYRKAAALDPHDPEVFNMLGASLRELGDDSGAVAAFHQALALDPDRATTLTLLGVQASLERRYDEALGWADSALAVDQGFYDAWVSRGFYRLFLGDSAGARADATVAARLPSGSHLSDRILLVLVDARSGHVAAARRTLDGLLGRLDASHPSPLQGPLVALALISVGDRQRGIELLERVEPRGAALWFWLRFPGFDTVRSDARFQRLVEQSRPG